jgi:hypothetical protein
MPAAANISYAIFRLSHFQVRASSDFGVFRYVGASSAWSVFRKEHYQVRAFSVSIFSSFEKN